MKEFSEGLPARSHVQIVGMAYLLYTFLGLVNSFLVKPGIYNIETFRDTASRYSFAQVIDLLLYVVVIWASWALYLVTRHVNKNAALLALLFRFGEGLLGCMAVLVSLMVPVILRAEGWPAFEEEQLRAIAAMFMILSGSLWNILFILMGIGAAIFMYLFHASRYVPRLLTFWGMFTYISMKVYGVIKMLFPESPEELIFIMFPGALFELIFGLWLLVRGINIGQQTIITGIK
jgi:hypothetical protein